MKKFTFILSLLTLFVATAGAQKAHQRVSHDGWIVTALNETPASGNEGGVAFIADDNAQTFYHSDWKSSYDDGNGVEKGKDGLQAFMVELPTALTDISFISYKGRSDNNTSGWARGVRIYVYETLPTGWPAGGLSSLGYTEKEELLAKTNTAVLGEPAFDNNESLWANDRTTKWAMFETPVTGKYVLFIMDSGNDTWLTCSDFQIYQPKEYYRIEQEVAYYLQATNVASANKFLDTKTPNNDTSGPTIALSTTPVDTYFKWDTETSAWHISSAVGGDYVSVTNWCATPESDTPDGWQLLVNDDETLSLFQSEYKGSGLYYRCFLGGDATTNSSVVKLYTDNAKDKAISIKLPETIGTGNNAISDSWNWTSGVNWYTPTEGTYADLLTATEGKSIDGAAFDAASVKCIEQPLKVSNDGILNIEFLWDGGSHRMDMLGVDLIQNGNIVSSDYHVGFTGSSKGDNIYTLSGVEAGTYVLRYFASTQKNNHSKGNITITYSDLSTLYTTLGSDLAAKKQYAENAITSHSVLTDVQKAAINDAVAAAQTAYDAAVVNPTFDAVADIEALIAAIQTTVDNAIYVSSSENLSNNIAYFVSNERGAWVSDDTRLNGTYEKGVAVDATSEEQHFAFLKSDKGNIYLYSVADKKFVSKSEPDLNGYTYTTFTDTPVQTVYFQNGTVAGYPVVVTLADGSQIGISTNYSPDVITFYNSLGDPGNCVRIELAAAFNPTEALALISDFENKGVFVNELTNIVNEIKAIVDKLDATKIGYYQTSYDYESDLATLETFIANINSKNANEIKEQITNAQELKNKFALVLPTAGKYYFIKNNSDLWTSGEYAVYSNSTAPAWKAFDENDITFWWIAEAVDGGGVSFKSVATETYLIGNATRSGGWSLGASANAIEFAISGYAANGNALMNIILSEQMHAAGHVGGAGTSGTIVSYPDEPASKWEIVESDAASLANIFRNSVGAELTNLSELADNLGSGYGYYSCDEEMKAEIESFSSNVATATYEQLTAMLAKINVFKTTFKVNIPENGCYLRIAYDFGEGTGGKLYVQGKASSVKGVEMTSATDAASIFYYGDGKLLSYTAGLYIKEEGNTRGLQAMGAAAGNVSFEAGKVAGTLSVKAPSYMHANSSGTNYFIDHCSGNSCAQHNMIVEAVTEIPVTVTEAGYATFYAPVAVTIPNDVEAYYATEVNGEYVSLKKIETAIPANTGVVLKAVAGTYNFAITTDEVEAIEGNIFNGTVNKQQITKESGSYYVLGVVDGKVGMYNPVKGEDANTFINAGHKAYMYLTAPANSAGYRFDLDGTTGITEVETNDADAVIYDLTGRRVQSMSRAGIYIVNGKKVLVK